MSATTTLTCLGWNLAMLTRSREAPPWWSQEHTEAEIRRLVLERSPDVVTFQELPGIVPYVETHDMARANPRSHSGNLATLVGNHLVDDVSASPSVVDGCGLLVAFPAWGLTVANVHLSPGRGAAQARLAQLRAVLAAATTPEVLILGDTNTRTAEERSIESVGLTAPRPPRPTWDGRRNRFNGPDGEFTAYFTRPLGTPGVRIGRQTVHPGRIEIDGDSFHVSDHFALEVEIEIEIEIEAEIGFEAGTEIGCEAVD